MKSKFLFLINLFLLIFSASTIAQNQNPENGSPHSILPADGVISYLPVDSSHLKEQPVIATNEVSVKPTVNFFFRPEATSNYKEAGMQEDTGQLNFYLRADVGAQLSLPKHISYGVYTRSFGPLDQKLTLYEGYVDMKKLDRNNRLSLRFGRMSLGKYGTEMLIGDDDFGKGRSFESIRLRYKTFRSTSDFIWAQLYQAAPDSVDFDWNHPIFLGYLNTFNFKESANLDANLVYIIDQYNSGFRTSVLMPNARFFGKTGNIRYSVEGIYQTGPTSRILTDEKVGDVSAYAMEVSAGYFSDDENINLDFVYYMASGDDNPGDTDIKSYNVLWQNEHRRFGFIDAFKGSNVQAATLHLNWRVGKLVDTGLHAVYANVLEQNDKSTGIATISNLNSIETESKSIGVGGDWYINYYYNDFLNMQLSASVFSPGEYFTAGSGIDKTMMRLYLMVALKI
jgi:hypothetical protein